MDAAAVALNRAIPESASAELPVIGSTGWRAALNRAPTLAHRCNADPAQVRRMVHRYGALTEEVLAPAAIEPMLAQPLPGAPGYLAAEYRYAVTHEGASTLEDVLWHRTHVSFETPDGGAEVAPHVATLIGPLLGWDAADRAAAVTSFRDWTAAERAAL